MIGQEEITSGCTGRVLDWILGNISSKRVVKLWNRTPKEVAESPLLEVFKRLVDVAPGDMD